MSITAIRVNTRTGHDRESSSFSIPQYVHVEGSGDLVIQIPFMLNVEYERKTYTYVSNADGTPLTEAQALTLEAAVKSAITKNVNIISVTQTDPTETPTVTDSVVNIMCGTCFAVRNGSASNWTVEVQEDTPTYSIKAMY